MTAAATPTRVVDPSAGRVSAGTVPPGGAPAGFGPAGGVSAGTTPADAVAAFVGAVQAFRAATVAAGSWAPERRRATLAEIERAQALLAGARADLIRAEQEGRTWRAEGMASLGARVGRDTGIGQWAGGVLVRQAETWEQVPLLARAAEAGAITTGHVDAVGRTMRTVDPAVREVLTSPEGQQRLVELAHTMDVPTFAKELARTAARLDPTGPDRDLERQRAARFLQLVDTDQGTRLTGLLDRQAGRTVRLAIEALTPRPAADDTRTAGQRNADALTTLADTVLGLKDTGAGAAVRPHVSLTMSVDTLAALRAAQQHRAANTEPDAEAAAEQAAGYRQAARVDDAQYTAGTTPGAADTTCPGDGAGGAGTAHDGHTPTAPDHADTALTAGAGRPPCTAVPSPRPLVFTAPVDPVTDEDGVVVPFSEVARILCDCFLTRIALNEDGEPLDLGRQARLYTGQQRRAVLARDRGCGWQGCAVPARWCEIHHIWWWDRDTGPTSVDNAVALCRFHHHEVHRRDLHLVRSSADLPPGVGRAGPGTRAGPGGLDPGRPTVRYLVLARDGTVVAGARRARAARGADDGRGASADRDAGADTDTTGVGDGVDIDPRRAGGNVSVPTCRGMGTDAGIAGSGDGMDTDTGYAGGNVSGRVGRDRGTDTGTARVGRGLGVAGTGDSGTPCGGDAPHQDELPLGA